MSSQAQAWADEHGFTDGGIWHGSDGVDLYHSVVATSYVHVTRIDYATWIAEWPDGSVLWARESLWDLAPSRAAALETLQTA